MKKEPSEVLDTFMTGLDAGGNKRIEFSNTDVELAHIWKAHADCINWVTYAVEIDCLASCSFDCNVYMWDLEGSKIGSLVLGSEKLWKIHVIQRRFVNDYCRLIRNKRTRKKNMRQIGC